MEIVLIVLGIVALAGLASMTLRMRSSRRVVRPSGATQWRGSAGAARRSGRTRVSAAAAPVAVAAASGGGTAVQDPPRTQVDEDAWDDDLEWTDAPEPAPTVVEAPPAGRTWGEARTPVVRPEPEPPSQHDDQPEPAVFDAEPVEAEEAWDDDLHEPAPPARRTAWSARAEDPAPVPVTARGAAAFGAATATPPAPRKKSNPLRSPVALVALYAIFGIALVVLAVTLLAGSMSPSSSKPSERARATKPAPKPAPPATAPAPSSSADNAAAEARKQLEFRRAVSSAVATRIEALRKARAVRRARIAARKRAAQRRRAARARARARKSATASPRQNSTPSYSAPGPSQAPAPPPSSGGSGGSGGSGSGGSGSGSGGSGSGGSGGGSGCEFCIG